MDFTLNLQTAAAFLGAAAGAAGGDPMAVAGDGASFSEILSQASDAAQADEVVGQSAASGEDAGTGDVVQKEDTVTDEDGFVYVPRTPAEDIMKLIENMDDGIKKGMRLLLDTMIKALMGDSSKDKKTDLFSMFYGGSGDGLFDDDTFLLGTELMYQFGNAMDLGFEDMDDVTDLLDRLLNGIYGKDDDDETDENTAADILAAMLSPDTQEEIVMMFESEQELAPAEISAKLFRLPKEIVVEMKPEDVPKMEKLYEDFKAEFEFKPAEKEDTGIDIRNLMGADRSALKLNDAADQIRSIGGDTAVQAELAAAVHNVVPEGNTEVTVTEIDIATARSVENQIVERISEKLFDMKGDNETEELVMVLKPENLGQVAVKLVKENGALSVVLSAQYSEVGKLMADRAAALSDSLSNRNVEVKDIEVVDPGSAAEQMGLNFTNQGFSFGRGQEYSSDEEKNSYSGIDEIDEITETEPEIRIIREAGSWQTTA